MSGRKGKTRIRSVIRMSTSPTGPPGIRQPGLRWFPVPPISGDTPGRLPGLCAFPTPIRSIDPVRGRWCPAEIRVQAVERACQPIHRDHMGRFGQGRGPEQQIIRMADPRNAVTLDVRSEMRRLIRCRVPDGCWCSDPARLLVLERLMIAPCAAGDRAGDR